MKKQSITMKKLLAGLCMAAMMLTVPVTNVDAASSEVAIDAKHFPDKTFRTYVSNNFDNDKNGKLSKKEITNAKEIDVTDCEIKSLTGIKYFTNLQMLSCGQNKLTKLDVSKNTKLTYLICYNNKLTKLDISKNKKLEFLNCENNKLTKLDVSKNTKLTNLCCSNNKLKKLNVSKNTKLVALYINGTELTRIDLSKNTQLQTVGCDIYLYSDEHDELAVELIGYNGNIDGIVYFK